MAKLRYRPHQRPFPVPREDSGPFPATDDRGPFPRRPRTRCEAVRDTRADLGTAPGDFQPTRGTTPSMRQIGCVIKTPWLDGVLMITRASLPSGEHGMSGLPARRHGHTTEHPLRLLSATPSGHALDGARGGAAQNHIFSKKSRERTD